MFYLGSYPTDSVPSGAGLQAYDDAWQPVGAPAAITAPSFVVAHPTLPMLYAVDEQEEGAVVSVSTSSDGLAVEARRPSGGSTPAHLTVSPDGRWLLAANYGGGSVGVWPLGPAGELGERASLRDYGHDKCHQVTVRGDEVTVVHLGLDRLFGHTLLPSGELADLWEAAALPGSGPRHQVLHPAGRRYVADELGSSLSVYEAGARTTSVPATGRDGDNDPSEVALSPDGRYVYVANRGADTIAVFTAAGEPSLVAEVPTGGRTPRHFAVDVDRLYVANLGSDTVTELPLVDGIPGEARVVLEAPGPACVLVVP